MDERTQKIKTIVNRANSDIAILSKGRRFNIQLAQYPNSAVNEDEYKRSLIAEIVLSEIKKYVNSESFCRGFWYSDANRTTFIVSDENLDIWAGGHFDFVGELYESIMDSIERNPWGFQFGKYLNDEYIQNSITSFFDRVEKH